MLIPFLKEVIGVQNYFNAIQTCTRAKYIRNQKYHTLQPKSDYSQEYVLGLKSVEK